MIHALILASILSTQTKSPAQSPYANVLNYSGTVDKPDTKGVWPMFDQGSWFGFANASPDSKEVGGFLGPYTINSGGWVGGPIGHLIISDGGQNVVLTNADAHVYSLPGRLVQEFKTPRLSITLSLVFASSSTALLVTQIRNVAAEVAALDLNWLGQTFGNDVSVQIKQADNDQRLSFKMKSGECFDLRFLPLLKPYAGGIEPKNGSLYGVYLKDESAKPNPNYRHISPGHIRLDAQKTFTSAYAISYSSTKSGPGDSNDQVNKWLANPEKVLAENKSRWDRYLQRLITPELKKKPLNQQRLAVKCFQTLLSNWKAPNGDILHEGVFPSNFDFAGFWPWDSWKHAYALADIAPELAKNQIRAMFDYQDAVGMIADTVNYDKKQNNWRNTKAPLSGWAVWKVFEETGDRTFLKEMYPKVKLYHEWWYKNRDHDKNGLCEYGSTDGTRQAAAWESGMDNAVRFDNAKMVQNGLKAWSLDQESVDLNSYLYLEKRCLVSMAKALNLRDEATKFDLDADDLKLKIRKAFYDPESGYFFDRRLGTHALIKEYGPEGWTPLWTQVATQDQASKVSMQMLNPKRFYTKLPLPTLDASNPKFDPNNGYWRGPVWLDQVYFGIEGLRNYGYTAEADTVQRLLLENAKGLLESALPIRENYHPITGEGLNANHFSWSAAHLLMLLRK